MSASIDTSELSALAANLAANATKTEAVAAATLAAIAKEGHDLMVSLAPEDTGTLKASAFLRGGKDWRRFGFSADYAQFVEFGTSDTAPQPAVWPAARRAEHELFAAISRLADPLT